MTTPHFLEGVSYENRLPHRRAFCNESNGDRVCRLWLLAGALLTVLSFARMMAGGAAGQLDNPLGSVSTLLFGLLGIVVFPALYGIFGALMAGLVTVIYNVVARKFGGLKFEVAESQPPAAPAPASHGFV